MTNRLSKNRILFKKGGKAVVKVKYQLLIGPMYLINLIQPAKNRLGPSWNLSFELVK
ncbi:hypothetical protein SAMN06269250_2137 [Spirosoma fluviale]|uniref:Uncharacterized protein n=1 Tax=Spirosoma fluviale TaxID=1597977 RepID=A0A286FGU4_9BACT|nr:hypothetical protein SAMN06269250_2137 [Spirosoma fluviale]